MLFALTRLTLWTALEQGYCTPAVPQEEWGLKISIPLMVFPSFLDPSSPGDLFYVCLSAYSVSSQAHRPNTTLQQVGLRRMNRTTS